MVPAGHNHSCVCFLFDFPSWQHLWNWSGKGLEIISSNIFIYEEIEDGMNWLISRWLISNWDRPRTQSSSELSGSHSYLKIKNNNGAFKSIHPEKPPALPNWNPLVRGQESRFLTQSTSNSEDTPNLRNRDDPRMPSILITYKVRKFFMRLTSPNSCS